MSTLALITAGKKSADHRSSSLAAGADAVLRGAAGLRSIKQIPSATQSTMRKHSLPQLVKNAQLQLSQKKL